MAEWQPIETAPTDGTLVLLAGGQSDQDMDAPEGMRFPVAVARWHRDAWIMALAEAGCVVVAYEQPRYWMSLPQAPV